MNAQVSIVFDKSPLAKSLVHDGALDVCTAGAEATAQAAREELTKGGKTGVHYRGMPNRSSAPYESPQDQMHALLESIEAVPAEDLIGIGMDAVAGTDYAGFLEFGTSRMAPRPFMGPASYMGEEAATKAVDEVAAELKAI